MICKREYNNNLVTEPTWGLFSFFRLSNDFSNFSTSAMDDDRPVRAAMHSYAKKSLDAAFKRNDAANTAGSKISLPETPKPPSKKSKMVDTVASENQTVSNLHLLEVLERVEKMQVEFLTRMQSLETTVNDNTNSLNSVTEALEFVNNQVEEMTSKVTHYRTGWNRSKRRTVCCVRHATNWTLTRGGGIYE